jgi:hypothetical protein
MMTTKEILAVLIAENKNEPFSLEFFNEIIDRYSDKFTDWHPQDRAGFFKLMMECHKQYGKPFNVKQKDWNRFVSEKAGLFIPIIWFKKQKIIIKFRPPENWYIRQIQKNIPAAMELAITERGCLMYGVTDEEHFVKAFALVRPDYTSMDCLTRLFKA